MEVYHAGEMYSKSLQPECFNSRLARRALQNKENALAFNRERDGRIRPAVAIVIAEFHPVRREAQAQEKEYGEK